MRLISGPMIILSTFGLTGAKENHETVVLSPKYLMKGRK